MKNVLIISGHPDLSQSVANAAILEELATALPDAEIRYLDKLYPNGQIDVPQEQEALLKADLIVWQFPFSWYSVPGLLKLWIDRVFTHGFAHGSQAKLNGKKLLVSLTAGAPKAVYATDGFFGHNIEEYFAQFESTARLCNLDHQQPIYTCGLSYVGRDQALAAEQRAEAKVFAQDVIARIKELSK